MLRVPLGSTCSPAGAEKTISEAVGWMLTGITPLKLWPPTDA